MSRRSLTSYLLDENAVEKLIVEIAPVHQKRNGGYTRIVNIGQRLGDGADMAVIEILDMDKAVKVQKEAKAPKAEAAKKVVKKSVKTTSTKTTKEKKK